MYEYDSPRTAEEVEAAIKKEAEFRARKEKINAMKDDVTDRLYNYIVKVSDNPNADDRDIASMIKAAGILLDAYL